ncbi:MAG: D-alanyl-D-alanine carboxypeptidase [Pseudomonadota bacterium]
MPFTLFRPARKSFPARLGVAILSAIFTLGFVPESRAEVPFAQMAVDANSGRVLHAVNPDGQAHPASLAKIMTLYLVFEAMDKGQLSPYERIRVSKTAAAQSPSKLNVPAGNTVLVRDAVLAVVTKSANDMAVALAERVAGGEAEFARAMTDKARALGMVRTVFRNASGLPHPAQVTTARDMTALARALIRDFPHHYSVFATPEFAHAGVTYRNHNQLLGDYAGADGIKTGYIRASGYNLVASAVRDKRRVISVVMGDRSPATRNARMAELLDRGFEAMAGVRVANFPAAPERIRTSVAQAAPDTAKTAAKTKPATVAARESRPAAPARARSHPTAETAQAAGGQWVIQVGAFHRYALAEQAAQNAAKLAPGTLVNGEIKIVPTSPKKGKPIYRARIAGLSKTEAAKACATLQTKNVACIRVPDDDTPQFASAS